MLVIASLSLRESVPSFVTSSSQFTVRQTASLQIGHTIGTQYMKRMIRTVHRKETDTALFGATESNKQFKKMKKESPKIGLSFLFTKHNFDDFLIGFAHSLLG